MCLCEKRAALEGNPALSTVNWDAAGRNYLKRLIRQATRNNAELQTHQDASILHNAGVGVGRLEGILLRGSFAPFLVSTLFQHQSPFKPEATCTVQFYPVAAFHGSSMFLKSLIGLGLGL